MTRRQKILILDFGSQYTQLIARRIREQKVYCEIHPYNLPISKMQAMELQGIVLSGGPSSCYDDGAPTVSTEVFNIGVPVLGICYGAQLTAKLLGGTVEPAQEREYGRAKVNVTANNGLFDGFDLGEQTEVWMSHGDKVTDLPQGFVLQGESANCPACIFSNAQKKIYCLQFHPEVNHTQRGKDIVRNFLFSICGCDATWTMRSFVDEAVEQIQQQVGETGKVICGLSGGVDSSVAAALLHRAIGDRLTCIFVDNGLLRQGERDYVAHLFADKFGSNLRVVDARDRFLTALAGCTDPEKKRKIIGNEFVFVFEEEGKTIDNPQFLAQGTLYPDVIESVSFKGPSAVIKSHHNVGGLPERMKLSLVEPLRELFKDEVRELGLALGLPKEMVFRHPFPGPGLAVRCLGEITEGRLSVLRKADKIIDDEIRAGGLYDKIWQSFGVLLPVKTVGVMGDQRTYEAVVAITCCELKRWNDRRLVSYSHRCVGHDIHTDYQRSTGCESGGL